MSLHGFEITKLVILSLCAGTLMFVMPETSIAKELKPHDNSKFLASERSPAYPRYSAGADRFVDQVTIDPCASFRWANRPYSDPRSVIDPQGRFSAGSRSRLPANVASDYPRRGGNLAGEVVIGQKTIAGRDIEISEFFELGDVYDYSSCQDYPSTAEPLK